MSAPRPDQRRPDAWTAKADARWGLDDGHVVLHVACHRGRGLISRAIQLQTWSVYSHVSLVAPWWRAQEHVPADEVQARRAADGRAAFASADLVLLEAREGTGVTCDRTLDEACADGSVIDVCPWRLTPAQAVGALRWFGARLFRRGYDYAAIVRFLARRDAHRDERWFCSEALRAAADDVGAPLVRRVPLGRTSPAVIASSLALGDETMGGWQEPIARSLRPTL